MQKSVLTMLLALLCAGVYAQKIDDIKKFAVLQKWDDAKVQVDKFLSVEKNAGNAEAWYYKGYIYTELAKHPNYAGTDIRMQAFDAYKKYQELDSKNSMMKDDNNRDLFILNQDFFADGVKDFNEKNYSGAFKDFKNSIAVQDYIKSKGFTFPGVTIPQLDTQLVQNTASAAFLAKDTATAMEYYGIIANAKVKGEDYRYIYETLVNYYFGKKDDANMNKFLALGKEVFPTNDYWPSIEWDIAGEDSQKKEKVLAAYPNDYALHYNYAAELYNKIYNKEDKQDNKAIQDKLDAELKKSIDIDNKRPEGNLLMALNLRNNKVNLLSDSLSAIKGKTPDDVKKKNSIMSRLNADYDDMLTYATAAYNFFNEKPSLKPGEKGSFRVVTNLILGYWQYKNDANKIKEYQDKMKSLD